MTNVKESLNSGYRILVVDDERDICRIISSILKEEGYRINKAYTGVLPPVRLSPLTIDWD